MNQQTIIASIVITALFTAAAWMKAHALWQGEQQ